jgi:hypothetical protein
VQWDAAPWSALGLVCPWLRPFAGPVASLDGGRREQSSRGECIGRGIGHRTPLLYRPLLQYTFYLPMYLLGATLALPHRRARYLPSIRVSRSGALSLSYPHRVAGCWLKDRLQHLGRAARQAYYPHIALQKQESLIRQPIACVCLEEPAIPDSSKRCPFFAAMLYCVTMLPCSYDLLPSR